MQQQCPPARMARLITLESVISKLHEVLGKPPGRRRHFRRVKRLPLHQGGTSSPSGSSTPKNSHDLLGPHKPVQGVANADAATPLQHSWLTSSEMFHPHADEVVTLPEEKHKQLMKRREYLMADLKYVEDLLEDSGATKYEKTDVCALLKRRLDITKQELKIIENSLLPKANWMDRALC